MVYQLVMALEQTTQPYFQVSTIICYVAQHCFRVLRSCSCIWSRVRETGSRKPTCDGLVQFQIEMDSKREIKNSLVVCFFSYRHYSNFSQEYSWLSLRERKGQLRFDAKVDLTSKKGLLTDSSLDFLLGLKFKKKTEFPGSTCMETGVR